MYLLSTLVEEYIYSKEKFNTRKNALYLLNWIEEMIDLDHQCEAMDNFQTDFDIVGTRYSFEHIINELGLLQKYGVSEIDEDFLFKISLYEYQNGYFDSACEFIYYKRRIADKLLFPYKIYYSEKSDEYYTNNMRGVELENFVKKFLKNIIYKNSN